MSDLEVVFVGLEEVIGLKEALPVRPSPISPLDLLAELCCAQKLLLQPGRHTCCQMVSTMQQYV